MATRFGVSGLLTLGAVIVLALSSAGCQGTSSTQATGAASVPAPINLLLPQSIRIHPFTGVRALDAKSKIRGLEVRMEAIDAYQDAGKAFGDFRFELYSFEPNSAQRKGEIIESWHVSLMDPKDNVVHWDPITRAYIFKLQAYRPIESGRRLILVAVFTSPYTNRLFAEYELVAQ